MPDSLDLGADIGEGYGLYPKPMQPSMVDESPAGTVAEAVAEYDASLPLYGLPDSALEEVARRLGLSFWREGFADRAYQEDGSLVDRDRGDAKVLDALGSGASRPNGQGELRCLRERNRSPRDA